MFKYNTPGFEVVEYKAGRTRKEHLPLPGIFDSERFTALTANICRSRLSYFAKISFSTVQNY